MKKKILTLALTLALILALAPSAFAATMPDETFNADWLGATFVSTVVTPHEYLGEVKIGNLWYWGGETLITNNFSVFVVEDDSLGVEVNTYTTSRSGDFYSYDYKENFANFMGIGQIMDGEVWLAADFYTDRDKMPAGTKEDPLVFPFYSSEGYADMYHIEDLSFWTPVIYMHELYSTDTDEYLGWISFSAIVFTKSQIAEFKSTGNLPPMESSWNVGGDDLSSYVDLTELKALLSDTSVTPPTTPPPAPQPETLTVNPTPSTVYVNGEATAFEAYLIGGNNYFKLRDLATAVNGSDKQFEIGYDDATRAITMTSGQPYTSVGGEMTQGDGTAKNATLNSNINIAKDGSSVEITAYLIGGNNFIKLRDVMKLFDIFVGYDNETRAITVDTSLSYVDE